MTCERLNTSSRTAALSWRRGLCAPMTGRAMPAKAYAPGRATHARQVKGQGLDEV
jgi:hypothetical protein